MTTAAKDHDKETELSVFNRLSAYLDEKSNRPLFLLGDSVCVLQQMPDESIDCAMTSPPYWGHREYASGGIGQEATHGEYIEHLLAVFSELRRVLRSTGSFWLNIGDTYSSKSLMGIPWRVALSMTDTQGWVLRNEVIWHKVKGGPDNAPDKLRGVHEPLFHFVKCAKGYFYDAEPIRRNPKQAKVVNGRVISATGVSGVRYRRQIELTSALSIKEKAAAYAALDSMLADVAAGKIADFRMIIRGQQRATHSDKSTVSGRARELELKGFYFLKYHPDGAKPGDVWDIIPEDTQKRIGHFAPYPEDLCRIPILSTCPKNGIVLDPFAGTGTTMLAAMKLGRKSVGIDVAEDYLDSASRRCEGFLL
jgi:DNA modification methylase